MTARKTTLLILSASALVLAIGFGCSERSEPEAQEVAALPQPDRAAPDASDEASADDSAGATRTPADELVADPEAIPTPTRDEVETHAVDGLRLQRFALTTEVREREPVAPGRSFEERVERLYAFVDVANDRDEAAEVIVTFERPDGERVGHVTLEIPPHVPRWRTWAFTRHVDRAGDWVAEVHSADGALLGRVPFQVEE